MLYMPITYFYSPKCSYVKVCYPGISSMCPCNLNNPVDFKTHFVLHKSYPVGNVKRHDTREGALWNAALSRTFVLPAPKSAAICRIFVLSIPWKGVPEPQKWGCPRTDKHKRTGSRRGARHRPEPLHDPYVTLTWENSRKIFLCNFRATVTY